MLAKGRRRMLRSLRLLTNCYVLWVVCAGQPLWWVTSMLILVSSRAWLGVSPLVGSLILLWHIRSMWGGSLMRLAGFSWMGALGPGGTLWLLAPMHWLIRLLVRSRMGVSRLTSLSLLSLLSVCELLRYLVLGSLSLFGLSCWVDTPDRSSSSTSKVVPDIFGTYTGRSEGQFLPIVSSLLGLPSMRTA